MIEISVRVSNEEQSYVKKHLEYSEDIILSKDCPKLSALVTKAVEEFKGAVDDVVVRIKMVW